MKFGKYKGYRLGEIPADYMLWLYDEMSAKDNPFSKKMTEYLAENLEYYQQQIGFKKKGF